MIVEAKCWRASVLSLLNRSPPMRHRNLATAAAGPQSEQLIRSFASKIMALERWLKRQRPLSPFTQGFKCSAADGGIFPPKDWPTVTEQ